MADIIMEIRIYRTITSLHAPGSTPTHQLLEDLHFTIFTISTLQKIFTMKAIPEKFRIVKTQSNLNSFLPFLSEQVFLMGNDWPFWNHGVFSYALTPRCHSTSSILSASLHPWSMSR
jgi:hypothetical protein